MVDQESAMQRLIALETSQVEFEREMRGEIKDIRQDVSNVQLSMAMLDGDIRKGLAVVLTKQEEAKNRDEEAKKNVKWNTRAIFFLAGVIALAILVSVLTGHGVSISVPVGG